MPQERGISGFEISRLGDALAVLRASRDEVDPGCSEVFGMHLGRLMRRSWERTRVLDLEMGIWTADRGRTEPWSQFQARPELHRWATPEMLVAQTFNTLNIIGAAAPGRRFDSYYFLRLVDAMRVWLDEHKVDASLHPGVHQKGSVLI